ncbi:MAG: LdpA C-terminal domain-containing domain [Cyanobacteriota bacterium]|nr:LdpA C-terminal domain-containing domain [Cyanobacteriota bacterium]
MTRLLPAPAAAALSPAAALASGRWVKWIGGASNQDLPAIEDLAGIYTLAGAHCLDLAADAAVVAAARRGIAWAIQRGAAKPWLMVSLSDGADPHFRKAWFDPSRCPPACPRPCARACPALAIPAGGAVVRERCYGCGRCLPACPLGLIEERHSLLAASDVAPLLAELRPDAVELHTRIGRGEAFAERLQQVRDARLPLRRLAVSCGLEGAPEGDATALARELWQRFGLLRAAALRPLWQLDGRPMSGDVGAGTAQAAVRLLRAVGPLAPPGPLQLAGGTNHHTLALVDRLPGAAPPVAGVAFGSVARQQLQSLLLEAQSQGRRLLDAPDLLEPALARARALVEPWLGRRSPHPQPAPRRD